MFGGKRNKACGSVLLLKQKQPVFLNVFVFMSFSRVLLERQRKPLCCLPQLRTQTTLLSATAKNTLRRVFGLPHGVFMKTSLEAGHLKIKQYDWKRGKQKQRLSNFFDFRGDRQKIAGGSPQRTLILPTSRTNSGNLLGQRAASPSL